MDRTVNIQWNKQNKDYPLDIFLVMCFGGIGFLGISSIAWVYTIFTSPVQRSNQGKKDQTQL